MMPHIKLHHLALRPPPPPPPPLSPHRLLPGCRFLGLTKLARDGR